jgi:hypothetical protein
VATGLTSSPESPDTTELLVERAYEIYLARGGTDGLAENDWLQAESEILDKADLL